METPLPSFQIVSSQQHVIITVIMVILHNHSVTILKFILHVIFLKRISSYMVHFWVLLHLSQLGMQYKQKDNDEKSHHQEDSCLTAVDNDDDDDDN